MLIEFIGRHPSYFKDVEVSLYYYTAKIQKCSIYGVNENLENESQALERITYKLQEVFIFNYKMFFYVDIEIDQEIVEEYLANRLCQKGELRRRIKNEY